MFLSSSLAVPRRLLASSTSRGATVSVPGTLTVARRTNTAAKKDAAPAVPAVGVAEAQQRQQREHFRPAMARMVEVQKDTVDVRPKGQDSQQQGVFLVRDCQEGETLLRFEGQVVPEASRWTIQLGQELHLSVTGAGAFVNHSCQPNTAIRFDPFNPKVLPWLEALRPLQAGAELTANYNATEWMMSETFACSCGSPKCVGHVGGFARLSSKDRHAMCLQASSPFIRKMHLQHSD